MKQIVCWAREGTKIVIRGKPKRNYPTPQPDQWAEGWGCLGRGYFQEKER